MYFNPVAQYMPNYTFGSLAGGTSRKGYPIKIDLKPNHSGDILAVVGLTAATVGLYLLGNTKGAKKTAEAAAKGGFWSKLFAKKGVEKAHKKIIKASNLISRDGVFFSKDGTLYTGWAKSWGKKMLYKDGVLVKTINRKGVQVALSQETPIQRRIRENILHKSICVKSAKESAEVFKKAEATKKPEHGILYRANNWFWDKTCGFLDKVFKRTGEKAANVPKKDGLLTRMHSKVREIIHPKELVFASKYHTQIPSGMYEVSKSAYFADEVSKMLKEGQSIQEINKFLHSHNVKGITVQRTAKANKKAIKKFIGQLQKDNVNSAKGVVSLEYGVATPPELSITA